jgi:catechol 2,3-dioxygenase-like lactoylglutathione lyase family enzyme
MEADMQYIGIKTARPDVLAEFYAANFLMKELASEDGNIAMTDGFYNLSLIKADADDPGLGFTQFGIHVDDLRELVTNIELYAAPDRRLMPDVGGPFHGDYTVLDPNGLPVTISTNHFGVTVTPEEDRELPVIQHIAISVRSNPQVSEFFEKVFGFFKGHSDGYTALAILPYPVTTHDLDAGVLVGDRHCRFGVNHFGFLVPSIDLSVKELPENTAFPRPSSRPMAEWRGLDPDGNEFDLSETKGYNLDRDRGNREDRALANA